MPAVRKGLRALVVTTALAPILVLVSDGNLAQADGSRRHHQTLAGLWYFDVPVPGPLGSITGFMNVREDGTLSMVRNVDAGGPPPPFVPVADMSSSSGQGLWRRAGRRFKGMAFTVNHDSATGAAIGMTRFRFTIDIHHDGNTASADYVDAWWFCEGVSPCPPDPTVVPPDIAEPPEAFPWTLKRIRIGH